MPRVDDIVTSLTVLSRVKANDKLNTREGYLTIETDTYVAYLKRIVSGDGRSRTLATLQTLFEEAFEMLRLQVSTDPKSATVQTLIDALRQSKDGLLNLKKTYTDDIGVQSRLDVIGTNIDQHIESASSSSSSS